MTRKALCAVLALDHALDHELPGHPITVASYFGASNTPEAGATHPAQTQPLAASPSSNGARRGVSSRRLAEPSPPPLRYDDTGFASDCLI